MSTVHHGDNSFYIIDVPATHDDLGHTEVPQPQIPNRLFDVGQCWMTPGALMLIEQYQIDPRALIARHATGDYGSIDIEDAQVNDDAIRDGLRVLSSYRFSSTDSIWIITEAGRHDTTLLSPDEY